MAQNVVINGVTYSNVSEVDIPKSGGGTAKFMDSAAFETDTTLSVPGMAADAAKTGEAVGELKSALSDISAVGKNLFDKDNADLITGYIDTTTFKDSNLNAKTIYVPIEPNKTYTVSKAVTARFRLATASSIPDNNVAFTNRVAGNTRASLTITSGGSDTWLWAWIYLDGTDTLTLSQVLDTVQVEEGSEATEYQPYILTAKDDVARASLENMQTSIAVSANSIPTFGNEMVADFSAMIPFGGASYANDKWTLTPSGGIKTNLPVEANKVYIIKMTVTSVTVSDGSTNYRVNPLSIAFGNDSIDIFANYDANWSVALLPSITGNAELSFTCNPFITVVMSALSVKAVKTYPSTPLMVNESPVYASKTGGYSLAFGGGHAKRIGTSNTAFGYDAQRDVDTGLTNSAFGYNAQRDLTNGRSNCAFGNRAQEKITTGMYNNAVGTVAQGFITSGCWNNAFGNEVQRDLTTGNNNVGIGRRAQSYLTTGNMNTAIGSLSGFAVEGHQDGSWATRTASYQTLVGGETTQASATEANYLTAIGFRAKGEEKATAIGANASALGEQSVAIGYGATATNDHEVVIGDGDSTIIIAGKRITFNQDGSVTWEPLT